MAQVYFETFFMAGVLSSQSYLQMKTLSAALEQSEEIMQWINVISADSVLKLNFNVNMTPRRCKAHLRALPAVLQQLQGVGFLRGVPQPRGERSVPTPAGDDAGRSF